MSPDTKAALASVSTATLCTLLFKRGLRNQFLQGVQALTPKPANMVGPATTLRYIPAREDIDVVEAFVDPRHPQRYAVDNIAPGHVLVCDCRGDARAASGGQILMTRLQVRGAAGFVSDGGIRDAGPIGEMDLPVFVAGPSAPLNLARHHAVEIDTPIACGDVAVYPGDIIVGDRDGVVVIPAHMADQIAVDAVEQERLEAFLLSRVAAGAPLPGTYPPNAETKALYEKTRK